MPTENESDEKEGISSKNPFAEALSIGISSSNNKKGVGSVFGSGFGTSKGFGSIGGPGNGGGFGSGGFGSLSGKNATDKPSGFSAAASNGSGWGSQSTGATAASSSSTSKFAFAKESSSNGSKAPVAKLPENVEVSNGEEGEEVLLEVRAKLFLLITKTAEDDTASTERGKPTGKPSTVGVPPSSETSAAANDRKATGGDATLQLKKDNKDEVADGAMKRSKDGKSIASETEKDASEKEPSGDREQDAPKTKSSGDTEKDAERQKPLDNSSKQTDESEATVAIRNTPANRQEWRERGTGPLRILKNDKHTRLVHRREAAPGGAGMMLLCNVVLVRECKLVVPIEKSLQLIAVKSNGHAESYLFRVKTSSEATDLKEVLEKQISSAKSCVAT